MPRRTARTPRRTLRGGGRWPAATIGGPGQCPPRPRPSPQQRRIVRDLDRLGRRAARLEHRLTHANASLADLMPPWRSPSSTSWRRSPSARGSSRRPSARWAGRASRLGTVVGFPQRRPDPGASRPSRPAKALEQGATQIDFVLNGGAPAVGRRRDVFNDMLAVVDMAHSALAVAGVIVEADPMSDDLVRRACRIAERAGADYVVTGTGARRRRARTVAARGAAARQRGAAGAGQGRRPVPDAGRRAIGRSAGATWSRRS